MNNLVIRLLVLAGVIYLVQKDILLALLLLTLYIMTSRKVSEYMENKEEDNNFISRPDVVKYKRKIKLI